MPLLPRTAAALQPQLLLPWLPCTAAALQPHSCVPARCTTASNLHHSPGHWHQLALAAPPLPAQGFPSPAASPALQDLLNSVLQQGAELDHAQVLALLSARGADMAAVCSAADELRRRTCGEDVSYVVNRNINYTNVRRAGCGAACLPACLPA
jgi:hypothetical protein